MKEGYVLQICICVLFPCLDTVITAVVCPKSKCTEFLFKCLLDSPEITSYLLQSMTLGKSHSGSNVFSTDHSVVHRIKTKISTVYTFTSAKHY